MGRVANQWWVRNEQSQNAEAFSCLSARWGSMTQWWYVKSFVRFTTRHYPKMCRVRWPSSKIPRTPNPQQGCVSMRVTLAKHSIRSASSLPSGEGSKTSIWISAPIGGHLLLRIIAPSNAISLVKPPSVCSIPSFQWKMTGRSSLYLVIALFLWLITRTEAVFIEGSEY